MKKFFKQFDNFADPVKISYQGRQSHPTWQGGILTVIVQTFLAVYFIWRCLLLTSKSKDLYFFTNYFTAFEDRDPYMLKDSDLKFRIAVIDPSLNIFDNPYCEIKLHRYTSLASVDDIKKSEVSKFQDKIIDIVDCDKDSKKENSNDVWNIG